MKTAYFIYLLDVLVLVDGGEFLTNHMYQQDAAYYDAFEKVYQNEIGYIAKIK